MLIKNFTVKNIKRIYLHDRRINRLFGTYGTFQYIDQLLYLGSNIRTMFSKQYGVSFMKTAKNRVIFLFYYEECTIFHGWKYYAHIFHKTSTFLCFESNKV